MPTPLRTMLKLIPAEAEGLTASPSSDLSSVAGDAGSQNFPSAMEVARWRTEADAQMEDLLTRFDAAIVGGIDPARVSHQLLHAFMGWTRSSLRIFHVRPATEAQRSAWSREYAVWTGLADLTSQDAPRDPAGVDRFLRIWLGVVHEATATGEAWMFVR
jgi:hypothetical protein